MLAIEKKAKRRIRRFIKTGEHQARVQQVGRRRYEYKVKHYWQSMFFKLTWYGHLKRIS